MANQNAASGLRRLIGEMLAEQLSALLSGDAATVNRSVERSNVDVEPASEPPATTRRRRRRQAPAVGYWLNVDKRTAKKAAANLAHNPATVLLAVAENPGLTNRQLTEKLADDVPAGKKAIESALDMLRTIDVDGEPTGRGTARQKKAALVVSRPLSNGR